jgi:elongation factor P
MRSKLKNVKTGKVIENTWRESDTFNEVRIERRKMEYLYRDGDFYIMMDTETYEQTPVDASLIGEQDKLLVENMEVSLLLTPTGEILGIELPVTVIHTITNVT